MNNNITPDRLIQYLDNELSAEERQQIEAELSIDPSLQQQLERLQLAKQAFGQYARRQQVAEVHTAMMQERKQAHKPVAKLRWLRTAMRVAAIVLVLALIAGVVQYSLLNNDSLYNEKYSAFVVSVTRANAGTAPIERAYAAGNMKEVIDLYENNNTRLQVGNDFLAGQAYLATNNTQKAINAFQAQINKKDYSEDAEYYLALAYLKAGNVAQALPLFEKIYSMPEHAYHDQVSRWYLQKLRWLKRKQS